MLTPLTKDKFCLPGGGFVVTLAVALADQVEVQGFDQGALEFFPAERLDAVPDGGEHFAVAGGVGVYVFFDLDFF